MTRSVKIENGVVTNIIVGELDGHVALPENTDVSIGWAYSDGLFMPPEIETPLPTQADYETAIQAVVDAAAKAKSYADGNSLATYANSTNPAWAAEATAFIAWRDNVWGYAYQQFALVLSGKREQPTIAAILAEIKANAPLNWPE